MAYTAIYANGSTFNMVKKFVIDSFNEIYEIDTSQLSPGSTAFDISSSKTYMLNNKKQWIQMGGGGGSQSDWSQNDDTKPDYIKNRPFYTGDPKEDVLFNGSFVFTMIGMGPMGERGVYNGVTDFSPEIGQTYQVSWDGTVYSCVATEYNSLVALGNLSIMNFGSDTGEPFLMTCGTGSINIYTRPVGSSHTISISKTVVPVVQIDPKYIRDMYYTDNPVEKVLVEESTATFTENNGLYMAEFPSTFEATVGDTYKISWDGTVYECTCVSISEAPFPLIGNLSIMGAGSDTGEPFLVSIANGEGIQIATTDTSASHTFSISGFVPEVVKIGEKYLPDVRSDWNVNDETSLSYVKNRPFYTGDPVETVLLEETTVSFSKNGEIYVGRLSPYTGSFPDEGKIYDVNWDGSIYQCTCYLDGSILTLGVLGNPDPFSIAFLADSSSLGIVTKTANSHTISISGFIDEIVKIDKKYLPELPKLPYMDEENPTGTGAFSLNRMVGSHVGTKSFAEGSSTEAIGDASHAEGSSTKAFGAASHAEGSSTDANGSYSHAEGWSTKAAGTASHAEGYSSCLAPNMSYSSDTAIINAWKNEKFTLAKGSNSHAEGENVLALGDNSHAEGSTTIASGADSHAEGVSTTASGNCSHTEGSSTTASGDYSHAEGLYTTATGNCSHAEGKYNIEDGSNLYAHIVGNGTSDTLRSNAHTLDWSGNAWFAGNVEGKALIISSSTEGSTKKFKITVDDSGALTATEVT